MALTDVVQIHGPTQVEIAVGIEAPHQRPALMVEIALHIERATESRVPARRGLGPRRRPPGEALLHALLALIRDHRQHPRNRQTGIWTLPRLISAALPARI